MSYDIYIGEAEIYVTEEGQAYTRAGTWRSEQAPTFDNDALTGSENHRHPGYGQWAMFCEAAELVDFFYNKETGLMREHPGCVALRAEHGVAIRAAYGRWAAAHPGAVPGFNDGQDSILARLMWLDFWVHHALTTCKTPVFYNS